MTLSEVLNTIRDNALTIPNINSVYCGNVTEINKRADTEYANITMTYKESNTDYDSGNITHTIVLFYIDRQSDAVPSPDANIAGIQSDGVMVLSSLYNSLSSIFTLGSLYIKPFQERFTDICAGVYAELEITTLLQVCGDDYTYITGDSPTPTPVPDIPDDCFFFYANADSSFWLDSTGTARTDLSLEYYISGGTATEFQDLEYQKQVELLQGQTVYIKGVNESGINTSAYFQQGWTLQGLGNMSAGGNLLSMIYGDNEYGDVPYGATFDSLFANNDALTDASDLILPQTCTATGCFTRLFYNCENLVTPPPSVTFRKTYEDSTVLSEVPQKGLLGCFLGCSSLTSAMDVYADSIGFAGFKNMYKDCTSLLKGSLVAPLEDTVNGVYYPENVFLASGTCYCMYSGCTAMTEVPLIFGWGKTYENSNITDTGGNFYLMFNGCKNLNTISLKLNPDDHDTLYYYGCNIFPFAGNRNNNYINTVHVYPHPSNSYNKVTNLQVFKKPRYFDTGTLYAHTGVEIYGDNDYWTVENVE